MKKAISVLALFTILLFAVSAIAQNKVVVVPLGKKPTGDAVAADVLKGKTFSNKDEIGVTGTLQTQTLSDTTTAVSAGFYNATDLATVDSDLTTGNIKSGTTIFGVTGTYPLAGVVITGQTTSYATGDDGNLQKGVTRPNPRFTDNGDGTVTDNLTGLIWLKNANCFGVQTWANALSSSNGLANGACGLTDGSSAGDWRLPNRNELDSLIDLAYFNPSLSNDAGTGQWTSGADSAFSGVQSSYYWSSSTCAFSTTNAWLVSLNVGIVNYSDKTNTYDVWPVRD
jgi:hypothetical protein